MDRCFIYALLDEYNNPFYIGATKSPDGRLKAHLSEAKLFLKVGEKAWVNDKIRKIASMLSNKEELFMKIIDECELRNADEKEIEHYCDLSSKYDLLQTNPSKKGRYTHAYKYR